MRGCTRVCLAVYSTLFFTGWTGIDREAARSRICAIPEIRNADRAVVENGGAGIEVYAGDQPTEHLNRRYWEVSVHEIYPDRHPRLETFLVSLDGKEILILDFSDAGPRYQTLKEWIRECRDLPEPFVQRRKKVELPRGRASRSKVKTAPHQRGATDGNGHTRSIAALLLSFQDSLPSCRRQF